LFSSYKRAVEETKELNLIPVMNLMMVLIPFLLLGAAFYHIGVIPVSTPTHDPHESDVPVTPATVTANLVLKADAVELTVSSTSLTEDELAALATSWKVKGGAYDLLAIQNALKELKATYPKSNTIIIIPHDGLNYQNLVDLLDHTREYQDGGTDKDNNPTYAELFPVTVFSRFIPVEANSGLNLEGPSDDGASDGEGLTEPPDDGSFEEEPFDDSGEPQ